jgi:AAA15 family ATPase/GTPase
MFKSFKISNFRTHLNTELKLQDLTLVIGSNNSGKSNLLAALSFFSKLVSNTFPGSNEDKSVKNSYYFANRHSLSSNDTPIVFHCEWNRNSTNVTYQLELYCYESEKVACRERLIFDDKTYENGFLTPINELLLRTIIQKQEINKEIVELIDDFFRSLAFLYDYNFQPSMLKGQFFATNYVNGEPKPARKRDFLREFEEGKRPNIASEIGKEGANFQELIKYVKEEESETYNKFLGFLKRFEDSFVGIHVDREQVKWQFDMGNSNFPYFEADKVSDGLIKAAAVALLCAMKRPPSVIMIEEVENGINQRNLAKFLDWLMNTSHNGKKTQFILTSHSPSVIREFADRIDCIYNVHLKKKKGYVSEVTNLNEAIKPLVKFGSIKEEEVTEENGVYHISPRALTELFYNGVLAEL